MAMNAKLLARPGPRPLKVRTDDHQAQHNGVRVNKSDTSSAIHESL